MVKTEYRRAFRSKSACSVNIYASNVDYRLQRRQVEHCHSVDPFYWPGEPESDSENSSEGGVQKQHNQRCQNGTAQPQVHNGKPSVEPQQQERPVKKSQHLSSTANGLDGGGDADSEDHEDVPKLDLEGLKIDDNIPNQKSSEDHAPSCPKHVAKIVPKQSYGLPKHAAQTSVKRPRKPGQKVKHTHKTLPKPRSMSAHLGHSNKDLSAQEEKKAPFIPYGFRDRERETGIQKTHNVRASVDVYPAALRAQRRRQLEIAARDRQSKSAPFRERRKKALFNHFDEKMQRETANWDTEYKSHYVGFEKNEYSRSNSVRAPHPRAPDHDLIGQLPPEHPCSYLRASF